jgi:hypothetical protein
MAFGTFCKSIGVFCKVRRPVFSHNEIVSWGPERHSDLGKSETS